MAAAGGGKESMLDLIVKQMKEESRVRAVLENYSCNSLSLSLSCPGSGDPLHDTGVSSLSLSQRQERSGR